MPPVLGNRHRRNTCSGEAWGDASRGGVVRCDVSYLPAKDKMNPQKFPLDFDTIKKGDTITEPVCREIIGTAKTEEQYQIGLLGLKQQIERELMQRGIVATIKITRKTIEVLTDAQASEYNEARQNYALKSFVTSHRRMLGVDSSKLTGQQVVEHDRRLTNGATYLTALTEARKTIKGVASATSERPKLFE